jgi:hypothetical protein
MEWKRRRKNIYFLIDSYSIKMEIPLKAPTRRSRKR